MSNIDSQLIEKLVLLAGERLTGRWLMLGGTILPLLKAHFRSTLDIDMFSLEDNSNKSSLQLMQLAQDLKLPVEVMNQAGAYFVRQIPAWQDRIVLVHKNNKFELYRPDINLFLALKIKRFSEVDLQDCKEMLNISPVLDDKLDKDFILQNIKSEILTASPEKVKRLRQLMSLLR